MIRNLNQVNFGSYGSVLPERAHSATPIPREEMESIALDSDCAPIYQAQSDTWICGSTGMTILSVCSGEDEYLHFYLDKPVSLKKDVQFGFWEKADDSHTVVRFATSWATRMEDVQKLLSLL